MDAQRYIRLISISEIWKSGNSQIVHVIHYWVPYSLDYRAHLSLLISSVVHYYAVGRIFFQGFFHLFCILLQGEVADEYPVCSPLHQFDRLDQGSSIILRF